MALEDPQVQQGLLATIVALLGGLWFWIKHHISNTDSRITDLNERMSEVEKNLVTRPVFDNRMDRVENMISSKYTEVEPRITRIENRTDIIYRDMARLEKKVE